jgi:basic amino acid/polyamine antiporter, APA family
MDTSTGELRREVGLPGAILMGLGSIVGTGLFVSLGIAAGVAGYGILLALPLAALLALFNGLSSAQLAAAHPVSGGTYEYGYRFLSPGLGFSAGWMFLLAKGASAATAALGLAGALLLLLHGLGGQGAGSLAEGFGGLGDGWMSPATRIALAGGAVILLTLLVAGGIRRSNRVNLAVVGATLAILGVFLAVGLPRALPALAQWLEGGGVGPLDGMSGPMPGDGAVPGSDGGSGWGLAPFLHATALLFVAYTGYGRIATLGEEVKAPRQTIPRAIWVTLAVVACLYLGVAAVALGVLGAEGFARATAETAAPLQVVAQAMDRPLLPLLLGVAALTAMTGVLLNLLLGLSRVALAMGRRGDLPSGLAGIHSPTGSPRAAVAAVGGVVLLLALLGDVRATWSFSAFSVLIYYGITNLAALRLPPEHRLYPRWVPLAGLAGCVLLAFQVEPVYWLVGSGLLAGGWIVRWGLRR